ncbi:hypothetical protein JW848_01310 [Candidatus Bipolaricaulota bacterium]|nr:hypothetical protein [Candidatus Bipolaricaulota bacterium]
MRFVHSVVVCTALVGIIASATVGGDVSGSALLAEAIRHELILSDDVCELFIWYTSETSGLICTPWEVFPSTAQSASEWNELVYSSLYEEGSQRAVRSQDDESKLVDILYVSFDEGIPVDASNRMLDEHFRQKAYCACNPETGACCGGGSSGVVLDVPLVSRIQQAHALIYAAWRKVAVFVPSTDCVPRGAGLLSGLREQLEGAASVGLSHIDLIHYDTQADLEAYEGDQTDIAILLAPAQDTSANRPLVLDICGEQMAADDAVDLLDAQRVILLAVRGDDTLFRATTDVFEFRARNDRLLYLPLVQQLAMDLPIILPGLQTGALSSLHWLDTARRLSLVSFFLAGGDENQ